MVELFTSALCFNSSRVTSSRPRRAAYMSGDRSFCSVRNGAR